MSGEIKINVNRKRRIYNDNFSLSIPSAWSHELIIDLCTFLKIIIYIGVFGVYSHNYLASA